MRRNGLNYQSKPSLVCLHHPPPRWEIIFKPERRKDNFCRVQKKSICLSYKNRNIQLYTMGTEMLSTNGVNPATKTITIRPSSLQPAKSAKNQQQIIVIPHSMLVNGCISAKDLTKIIDDTKPSIKSMENRTNLKRPSSSGDSTYGTDSEEGSSIHEGSDNKPVRKRANLDHLSPEEKLMRRKLKNRVAAQNARDKKRVKMEDMEGDLERLKAHAKALETRNAQLVSENERLVAQNDQLRSDANTKGGQEVNSPLVVRQSPESAEPTNDPQQQEQGCRLLAGGPLTSTASLVTASKLLLNVIKANRRQKKLPIKKRARWPT